MELICAPTPAFSVCCALHRFPLGATVAQFSGIARLDASLITQRERDWPRGLFVLLFLSLQRKKIIPDINPDKSLRCRNMHTNIFCNALKRMLLRRMYLIPIIITKKNINTMILFLNPTKSCLLISYKNQIQLK